MKYLAFLVVFVSVASAVVGIDMTQFYEHFVAVGCTKTPSSGSNVLLKVCGTCLRFVFDVKKIDQGSCANLTR
ncbi:hypothetical protein HNY73_022102 [Argiope bruennichi]|uniref:Uncharacterized protein n=1 Tax=Argiope bruennichi TaxID=94029 RepID=A0A8T0DZL6_ARGBR|nr:hypothetical protein HNY73_022102 [Argiope bruennichi]